MSSEQTPDVKARIAVAIEGTPALKGALENCRSGWAVLALEPIVKNAIQQVAAAATISVTLHPQPKLSTDAQRDVISNESEVIVTGLRGIFPTEAVQTFLDAEKAKAEKAACLAFAAAVQQEVQSERVLGKYTAAAVAAGENPAAQGFLKTL